MAESDGKDAVAIGMGLAMSWTKRSACSLKTARSSADVPQCDGDGDGAVT